MKWTLLHSVAALDCFVSSARKDDVEVNMESRLVFFLVGVELFVVFPLLLVLGGTERCEVVSEGLVNVCASAFCCPSARPMEVFFGAIGFG